MAQTNPQTPQGGAAVAERPQTDQAATTGQSTAGTNALVESGWSYQRLPNGDVRFYNPEAAAWAKERKGAPTFDLVIPASQWVQTVSQLGSLTQDLPMPELGNHSPIAALHLIHMGFATGGTVARTTADQGGQQL